MTVLSRKKTKQYHQAGRYLLVQTRQQEQQRQRTGAHGKSHPVGLGKLFNDPQQLLNGVPFGFVHPEQLIKLPDRDKDRQPLYEAVHNRLGEELRDESQLCQARQEKNDPDNQHKSRGVSLVSFRIRGIHRSRGN